MELKKDSTYEDAEKGAFPLNQSISIDINALYGMNKNSSGILLKRSRSNNSAGSSEHSSPT